MKSVPEPCKRGCFVSNDALDPRIAGGQIGQQNRRRRRSPLFVKAIGRLFTPFCSPPLCFHGRQDLVQAFFAHLLAQNTLSRRIRRGASPHLPVTILQNFLINEHDVPERSSGWRHEILSPTSIAGSRASITAMAHLNDVTCYDLTWASNIVTRAWQSLREAFAAEDKAQCWTS